MNLFKYFAICLFFVQFVSCKDDDDNIIDPPITLNIVETALTDSELTDLVAALQKAELVDALTAEGNFTVLAPTNDAFKALLASLNTTLDDIPTENLKQILLNHVIKDKALTAAALKSANAGYENTMATYQEHPLSLYFNTVDGVKFNGASSVTQADIKATNGIIHKVDAVIELPTVLTFAAADLNFSSLLAALSRADQSDVLNLIKDSGSHPVTIFAPTDAAFSDVLKLIDPTGVVTLETIPAETLTAALQLHAIINTNIRSTDLKDGPVATVGGEVTINAKDATITDANARASKIISADVQATDGIIHAIDAVILPKL